MENAWIQKIKTLGTARLIILGFMAVLLVLALAKQMDIAQLATDSLARIGRNGILVLALIPMVRGGCGLNFGLPLGLLCGLLAMILGVQFEIAGWAGFAFALTAAVAIASVVGYFYGLLLNRVKGDEMTVGTYLGFATVSLLCIFWTTAPFTNRELLWTIGGKGLRVTIPLDHYYKKILDDFLSISIGHLTFPTGLILFFLLLCGVVWFFFRTRSGIAIAAAGQNPNFARASGIVPDKARLQATMLSTALAAIGMVVYCQSFGFVQLYNAPLMMAFPIVACLLIGGGSVNKSNIAHVIFGAFVFETLLTVALPVTSQYIEGDISEVARVIISNGIILYALAGVKTRSA